jgi:hypothetical protein
MRAEGMSKLNPDVTAHCFTNERIIGNRGSTSAYDANNREWYRLDIGKVLGLQTRIATLIFKSLMLAVSMPDPSPIGFRLHRNVESASPVESASAN